jgi:hypothetical protein
VPIKALILVGALMKQRVHLHATAKPVSSVHLAQSHYLGLHYFPVCLIDSIFNDVVPTAEVASDNLLRQRISGSRIFL